MSRELKIWAIIYALFIGIFSSIYWLLGIKGVLIVAFAWIIATIETERLLK